MFLMGMNNEQSWRYEAVPRTQRIVFVLLKHGSQRIE